MAHYKRAEQPRYTGFSSAADRLESAKFIDELDAKMGFERFDTGAPRVGWLVNFQPTSIFDDASEDSSKEKSAVDFYFLDEEGGYFKSTVQYDPYFYVRCSGSDSEAEVEEYLRKRFEGVIKYTRRVVKEDLSLPNHLLGNQLPLIELVFWNEEDMSSVRRALQPLIAINKKREDYIGVSSNQKNDPSTLIVDLREHDVPYHVRLTIDLDIRVGKWYTVVAPNAHSTQRQTMQLIEMPDRIVRADPVVMAFDIETTKPPLKFPDAHSDAIMMISYMIDGRGYLITNREIVAKDIGDFEYTPKPEFKGEFTIFNEPSERDLLVRFFEHIRDEKPTVIATYNGDSFDWPFVHARATTHGLNMYEEIGFDIDKEGEYKSSYCVHMDCFRWVKRDSYLPQGSQGLKAVTTAKLGYNPLEIDPELMTPYATEKPQVLSEYSVSDAVATYYLYMKYVHPFIFSLCNILPLRPDEVLRKGTGTLCEMLLMVQAYQKNIVLPHKHTDPLERYDNHGHIVESETYVGGHVEALEAGVFRSDIPTNFNVDTQTIDDLLSQLDDALKFTITEENKVPLAKVTNYDAVKQEIESMLLALKANPKRVEEPLIYHVDVASMYPNIMTSNRLQPDSMKSEHDCAMCDFNVPGKNCDRRLKWSWRVEYLPPKRDEVLMIENGLKGKTFKTPSNRRGDAGRRSWDELSKSEQLTQLRQHVSDYSRAVYHKLKESQTVEREAIICQRENPFYVNTVRDFRDRRYEFKGKQKVWKQNLSKATSAMTKEEAAKMVVLYDSLQLAHKVILNSFYGYVMRKGSRWYSMEMAGVTCLTGATIIQLARKMVERLGRPLELDTDGIWCILPKSFPGDMYFDLEGGKKIPFAYPCVMLNHLVHKEFTNHQYQTLVDSENLVWETSSDNTIFFEVDGPYKAMMLPSSTDEGKGLKKRYAVFNFDGSLAELKGFEMKRRGELQLIKTYQTQLFSQLLEGDSLKDCYAAVAKVANSWLDVLDSKGESLEDVDLMNLISENKSMSKSLEEYGVQKSTSITTARRLAEFLGKEMVKDKGLACQFIISAEPSEDPVTNRAIPIQIFNAPLAKKQEFLRRWLKKPQLNDFDPRAIIDWGYYRERLSANIQRLIVIPAARQKIPNPVPRVSPPAWLARRIANESDGLKQQTIKFAVTSKDDMDPWGSSETLVDIEDTLDPKANTRLPNGVRKAVVKRKVSEVERPEELLDPEHAPDPEKDYQAWVVYMKVVWQQNKAQHEARRKLFGPRLGGQRARGIQGFFQQQTESTWAQGGGAWQIIGLSASPRPGEVLASVYVNERVQTVKILVPRTIFVKMRANHLMPQLSSKASVEPSDWTLPSGITSNSLYRVTMTEEEYQSEQFRVDGLFKNRGVEAIYEQHVGAVDRALLKLGACCRLESRGALGLLGRGLTSGFELDWLEPAENGPAQDGRPKLDYIFLQHTEVHGRHIVVIGTSWAEELTRLEFAPRASLVTGDWAQSLAAEYASQMAQYKPEQPFFELPGSIRISKSEIQTNIEKFWNSVVNALSPIAAQKPCSAVTIVQSSRGLAWLNARVSSLRNLPVVSMASVSGSALPAVGWESLLAKRIVKSILRFQYSLQTMQTFAQHVNIPLSNLPIGDDMRRAVDVVFARRLMASKHILWWGEAHTNSALTAIDLSNAAKDLGAQKIDHTGIYPHVCLDMSLSNLVVNTILTSPYLTAAEGTEEADPALLVDAISPLAWRSLVALTREWWQQASDGNESADLCVQQLSGWVASPGSQLWTPKLAHQIHTLGRKALSQLYIELKKFGTSVIFTERDGQRLLVATTKKSAQMALAFGGLLVREIKSKNMFTYLDVSVDEVWDFLVWMNSSNFCGRLLSNSGTEDSVGELEYTSTWQIAEYLPSLLRDEFLEWVLQFMAIIAEKKDLALSAPGGGGMKPIPPDFMHNSLQRLDKPLTNRVRQLQGRFLDAVSRNNAEGDFSTPVRAGTRPDVPPENPVLAFVKTLTAVFSLTNDTDESTRLKRKLLALLQVGDFDPAARFQDPAAKLIVPEVVCGTCMACSDVDVCNSETASFTFTCPSCNSELDRVLLEERLVQMLVTATASFQLQDLVCVKCGKLRPNDLAVHCPCSGQFRETKTVLEVQKELAVYRHVGNFYGLRLLNDLMEQV